MTEEQMKKWIDSASYEELLCKWRFSPVGDPFFQGKMGDYYGDAMRKKREEAGSGEHVRASKSIGWE